MGGKREEGRKKSRMKTWRGREGGGVVKREGKEECHSR